MAQTYVYSIAVNTSFVDALNHFLYQFPLIDHLTFPTLLSALQFMEQKPPKLVLVHGGDYPRHWKILSQLIEPETKLILFHQEPLDPKELKKAEALGVTLIDTLNPEFFAELLPSQKEDSPRSKGSQSYSEEPFEKLLLITTNKKLYVVETIAKTEHSIRVKELPAMLPTTFKALLVNNQDSSESVESLELINPSKPQSVTNQSENEQLLFFLH